MNEVHINTKQIFLTAHCKAVQKLFNEEDFLSKNPLVVIQGGVGAGKSILLQLAYHCSTNAQETLFLDRPFYTSHDFFKALCEATNLPYDETMDAQGLQQHVKFLSKQKNMAIFIDACELMDYEQMKMVAWLHQNSSFNFVLSIRSSEFEKEFYAHTLMLQPNVTFTCNPFNLHELHDFCLFTLKHSTQEKIASLLTKEVLETILHYTKGNVRDLEKYLEALIYAWEFHHRTGDNPKELSCSFLANIALDLNIITPYTYKKECGFHTVCKSISYAETFLSTASVGLVCTLLFLNTIQLHATYRTQEQSFKPTIEHTITAQTPNTKPSYNTLFLKVTPPHNSYKKKG
jgi:hypothetical protein